MWILRFDYRFHYGNQPKGLAEHLCIILMSSEDTDRVTKWFYNDE